MNTIVVGYDETEPSKRALERAADLAEKFGSRLLITSVAPVMIPSGHGTAGTDPTEGAALAKAMKEAPFVHAPLAACIGLLAVVGAYFAAYALYAKAVKDPLPEKLGALSRAMRNRFYFDEIYQATVIRLHDIVAAVASWIDRWVIAGVAVRGTHGTTELFGRALRLVQTGNLQTYAFLFAVGVAVVLLLVMF